MMHVLKFNDIGESKTFENVSVTVCNLGVRVIKSPQVPLMSL